MKDLVECGKITKKRWKRDIGTQKNADGAYDHKGATLRQREVMEKFVPALNRLGIDLMLCGHEHRYEFEAPSGRISFPVLTNGNETAVVATYDGQALEVQVVDTKGSVVERKRFAGK